jgi:hypothetical protein
MVCVDMDFSDGHNPGIEQEKGRRSQSQRNRFFTNHGKDMELIAEQV